MNNIVITKEEYVQLLRAKVTLELLEEAYNKDEAFEFSSIAKSIFKKEGGDE